MALQKRKTKKPNLTVRRENSFLILEVGDRTFRFSLTGEKEKTLRGFLTGYFEGIALKSEEGAYLILLRERGGVNWILKNDQRTLGEGLTRGLRPWSDIFPAGSAESRKPSGKAQRP